MSAIAMATFTSIITAFSFKDHENSRSNEPEIENILKILFNYLGGTYSRKETKNMVIPFSIKFNFKQSLHTLSNTTYWP